MLLHPLHEHDHHVESTVVTNQPIQWFKEGVEQVFLHGGFMDKVHGKINKEVY